MSRFRALVKSGLCCVKKTGRYTSTGANRALPRPFVVSEQVSSSMVLAASTSRGTLENQSLYKPSTLSNRTNITCI